MNYVLPFEVWVDGCRELMTENLEEALSWFEFLQKNSKKVYVIDNSYPCPITIKSAMTVTQPNGGYQEQSQKNTMNYQEFVNKTAAGTCTHAVELTRNGQRFMGIYNGLACWGEVWGYCGESASDGFYEVIQLQTEWVEDESDEEGGYVPNFTLYDFIDAGFEIANPPEWLKQSAQTVGA